MQPKASLVWFVPISKYVFSLVRDLKHDMWVEMYWSGKSRKKAWPLVAGVLYGNN